MQKEDRQWIAGAIQTGLSGLQTWLGDELQTLELRLEQTLEKKLEEKLEEKLDQKLSVFYMDICAVIADGFAHAASTAQIEQMQRKWEESTRQLKSIDVAVISELKARGLINPKRANTIASLPPYPQKLASFR